MTNKSTNNHPKIYQKYIQNLSNFDQKSVKIRSCIWEGSGGHLGPKRAPRANKASKSRFAGPPWDPQVGVQNPPKIDPEAIPKAINFVIDFWMDFWWILESKINEKSIKNQLKIGSQKQVHFY